jgi:hypothetical protein
MAGALDTVSPALVNGAVAALFGVLGFVGKSATDAIREKRAESRSRFARLKELEAFLLQSGDLFRNQNYKAKRLLDMLQRRLGARVRPRVGYDATFHDFYEDFTDEERELFELIRGTTRDSMRKVNEDMKAWIRANPGIVTSKDVHVVALAEQLRLLDLHLSDWLVKFHSIFEGDWKHALVYLADERRHGLGFPTGIEAVLQEVLTHR